MKRNSPSERLLLKEVTQSSRMVKTAARGLSIGALIKIIRTQLGMSQKALAKRAKVPQSTISRIEQGQRDAAITTLQKILDALGCDLVIAPLLNQSIDSLRQEQARKVAEKRVKYLTGTMNLEDQQPDSAFVEELLKQEENQLLNGPDTKLWE